MKKEGMRALGCLGVALALVLAGVAAWADEVFPSRPMRLVVPFAAGGGVDNVARILAGQLTQSLGQSVVVENRAGAGGLIGTDVVAKSAPDGYTMLMATQTTLAVAPILNKSTAFNPRKDFAGVSMVASSPLLLVVNPNLPVYSVEELIAWAKAPPGPLNYASGGVGSTPHMAMELLASMMGMKMTHIIYKGELPALIDVMGNRVSVMFANYLTALPQVKAGRLRALGVSSMTRVASLPDVPTVAEAGVAGFETATWFGVVVPATTPRSVVDKLNDAIRKVMGREDVLDMLQAQGLSVQSSTPREFDAYIASEYDKWARVIKNASIQPE